MSRPKRTVASSCAARRYTAPSAAPTRDTCSRTVRPLLPNVTASTPARSASTQQPNRGRAPDVMTPPAAWQGASLCYLIHPAKPTSYKLASRRELWREAPNGDAEDTERARTEPERGGCEERGLRPVLDAVLPACRTEPRTRVRRAAGERIGPTPARGVRPHRRRPNSLQPPPRQAISRLPSW